MKMRTARVSVPAGFWDRLSRSEFLERVRPTLRLSLREAFAEAERPRPECLRVWLTLEQVRVLETYAKDVVEYFSTVRDRNKVRAFRHTQTMVLRLDAVAEGLSRRVVR